AADPGRAPAGGCGRDRRRRPAPGGPPGAHPRPGRPAARAAKGPAAPSPVERLARHEPPEALTLVIVDVEDRHLAGDQDVRRIDAGPQQLAEGGAVVR